MEIIRLEGPDQEPITYKDAKDQLKKDQDFDKRLILSYLSSAREWCEDHQNRIYLTTKLKLIKDEIKFPLKIPRPPIQDIEKIEFQRRDGELIEWETKNYITDLSGKFGFVDLSESGQLPDIQFAKQNRIQITYTAGHENPDEVSEKVKQAIRFLMTHFEGTRIPVVIGTISTEVEFTVKALLEQDRVVNF